jgi:hypothetical protein
MAMNGRSAVLLVLMTLGNVGVGAQGFVIDHTCTDSSVIPPSVIAGTRASLHIAYNHTSHGSQLISGLNALEAFPAFGGLYAWSENGSPGTLHLDDEGITGCAAPDLSQGDYLVSGVTPWVACTRAFLDANPGVNVIMWSWCSINGHDAQRYVDNMEILVTEYPDVHFVFMTGHAEGEGEDMTPGGVHANNELIRAHCRTHGRILFDFADIEAWDPDGDYYWDQGLWDNLDYSGGNWAEQWIAANPQSELAQLTTGDGVGGYDGMSHCAHSDSPQEACLNCVLKGRAAWWLFSLLSEWSPGATVVHPEPDPYPNCAGLVRLMRTQRPAVTEERTPS